MLKVLYAGSPKDSEGMKNSANAAGFLGDTEGLAAHANAARIRLN